MSLKLLYITNGINNSGGLERVLSIKASYFADKLGYEVFILSLNDGNVDPFYSFSQKITFLSIKVKGNVLKYILSYKSGIQNVVDEVKPDIISVCDDGLKAFFLPTIIKTPAKWIYERHVSKLVEATTSDSLLKKGVNQVKWLLMDKLGNTYDHFIVLSNGNKKEWRSLQNLKVISNPLSFPTDVKSDLKTKRIIAIGRQSYQKGYDYLLQVWAEIEPLYPDWRLDIFGKIDPSLELNEMKNKLRLSNVNFYEPVKDIQLQYLESSIYVMTSRYEGFGMVLTEAMSFGIPCISFNCNYGPSDIISNNIDGYLIENFDITQFVEKTILLMNDVNLRQKLGSAAGVNVERYSMEQISEKWERLFTEK